MLYGVIKWEALPEFVSAEKAWCITKDLISKAKLVFNQCEQPSECSIYIISICNCLELCRGESLKSIWWKHEKTKSLHQKGKMSHSLLKAVRFTTGEILHLSFNHPFTYKYILSTREWFEVRQSFKQLKVFKTTNPFFGQESWNPFSPSLFLSHFPPFFSCSLTVFPFSFLIFSFLLNAIPMLLCFITSSFQKFCRNSRNFRLLNSFHVFWLK